MGVNWSRTKNFLTNVGVIATAGALLLGIVKWVELGIDSHIEHKLSDPVVLRKIAAESRPSIIFDAGEAVIADLGGWQFIKSISVVRDAQYPELAHTIDVDFNVHLPIAPLLTPLHSDTVTVSSERGKGLAWRYKLEYTTVLAVGETHPDVRPRTYRLELIR